MLLPATNASAQTNTNCPLVMNCPSNIVVTSCFNVQEFYNPTASNYCCGVLYTNVVCTPPSGSIFALGTTTTVTCSAIDCFQNTNYCTFTVTVQQGANCATNCLQIQCPSNIVVSSCTNLPVYYAPTVTDPCCGTNWTLVCTPPSGSFFAPNTTNLVDCFVTDYCGLSNSCSFTVIVLPDTNNCPTNCITLECPSNIAVATCSNCMPVFYSAAATNTCCFGHVVVNCNPASGFCFPLGTNVVNVSAYDPDCASTPPTNCSFTVTVTADTNCCTNQCCGPGLGQQTINWLQLPTNGSTLVPNPSGSNGNGTWIITNLPGYGNVLVTQDPDSNVEVLFTKDTPFDNVPNNSGLFEFPQTGYGPYTWGTLPGWVDLYYNVVGPVPAYNVNFYFLDGPPNPCNLVLAVIAVADSTTNTVSQPVTFRAEYDLTNSSGLLLSAYTMFSGTYGPPLMSGVSGTVVGSAYTATNVGNYFNTGFALFQPDAALLTTNLPMGSGTDVNGNAYPGTPTNVPYVTFTVNHEAGDSFGLTVGYICCTNCPTNCLQVQCPTNKSVPCDSAWAFDLPTATSCCTNEYVTGPATETNVLITPISTVTNGVCPQQVTITQSWLITDGCGDTNTCSQVVTVECCPTTNCLNLVCPSNIVVTTCSNCVPVFYSAAAYACCTNISALIYDPPSGTCFNLGTSNVTVTAYACGFITNCQFTVKVNPGTNCCATTCCGPDLGAQTINWLELPTNNSTFNPDPSGLNTNGTWLITNMPCYGRVLVTQNLPPSPNLAYWFLNPNMVDVTNSYGNFADMEAGYGPYSWGVGGWADFYNGSSSAFIDYSVNFYFLDGQPNPCTLFLGVIGLGESTTATVSQPVTFRGEFDQDANAPVGNGYASAYTMLDSNYPAAGITGTVVGSAYSITTNYGDPQNTGWALLQPTNALATTLLPPGSGSDLNGDAYPPSGTAGPAYPYLTLTVHQEPYDGIGFTVGYVCCTPCPTNCLQVECPTNKTVPCDTKWGFDQPKTTSCCTSNFSGTTTNVLITSISTVTNGVCPKFVTNTWLITDACGDSNTCSQVVTVVDTTPPMVHCPTNTVVVPLNSNCLLVIPSIHIIATDNCTPASLLVYSQSPPAGTIVPGPSATVTVTVTDLCGNSSQCIVTVLGESKTGPVVTCPTNMTVTNCTVPCVPVTVTDCACPLSAPIITQSPPCGTPIGPGITSVIVTVTDCHGNSTTQVVSLSAGGPDSFLSNLTNTGVGPGGILLADDTVDPNYLLPPAVVPAGMPADYFGNAVAVSDICHGAGTGCAWLDYYLKYTCYIYAPWSLPPDPAYTTAASKWIAPDYTNNGCCPGGNYTYTLNFVLPAGFNQATATISGRWAADNAASMKLNGVTVPLATPGFSYWTPFTIPPGSGFVIGANSLKFIVDNYSAWTGLRVEFTNAYANCSTCAPPVIHWITPPQSLQAGSTATFSVIAGGTPPLTYQWSHNYVSLAGDTNSTLQLHSIGYSDAGLYSVVISNPCGVVTGYVRLNVTPPWWWQWGWWNVTVLTNPLAATVGPALNLVGSSFASNYAINAGTTEDFGLPGEGGQTVIVMDVNPQAAASIQVPLIAAPGSYSDSNYTVIMDIYEPDTSLGTPSTLCQSIPCCVSNLSSGGQDGVALTLDVSNNLHITGSAAGVAFDTGPAANLAVDSWNRVALVVDDPQDGVAVNLGFYLNGQQAGSLTVPTPVGLPINWSNGPPTLLSVETNAASPNAEFYVSSIQFHDIALSPEAIAGMGSPDNGPPPANKTWLGTSPVLSATMSKGTINITWSGSPYVLQETTDLSSGVWADSTLAFTEGTDTSGDIVTTAVVTPAPSSPSKFYRLVFSP
ncbi:MAG: HYR domain-containing protein [Verrucomicrobiota bacterium]